MSDLDGTFLSPDGSVSEENAAAVVAAQDAGIPVLFATGRPVRWLEVIADLPGAHPTVIASNGAVLYDLGSRAVLDAVTIAADVATAVTSEIRAALPETRFGLESGTHFGYEDGYRIDRAEAASDPAVFTDTLEVLLAAGPYVKILVRHPALDSERLAAAVLETVGERVTVTYSGLGRSGGLLEVSAPGVSKASMLRRHCESLGIAARDVAAFGDMPNDMDMLAWAGHPHVMANAHPLLHDIGATVVGPNSESGVGRRIRGWLSQTDAGQTSGQISGQISEQGTT